MSTPRELSDQEILAFSDAIRAMRMTAAGGLFEMFLQRYEDAVANDALDDPDEKGLAYWRGRRDQLRALRSKFDEVVAMADMVKAQTPDKPKFSLSDLGGPGITKER